MMRKRMLVLLLAATVALAVGAQTATYRISAERWYQAPGLDPVRSPMGLVYVPGVPAASQPVVLDSSGNFLSMVRCESVAFVEDGSGTSYVGAVAVPLNALVLDIQFRSTVLWDGTSAALDMGDVADPNGYFAAIDLKATDLLVGEVLSAASADNWGGKNGVYLVAATGLRGALFYPSGGLITATVTPGAADGSAGRSFLHVFYVVTASTVSVNT